MAGHSPCILKLINAPDDMRFSCAIFIPALDVGISYIHSGRFYCIGVAAIGRYLRTVPPAAAIDAISMAIARKPIDG